MQLQSVVDRVPSILRSSLLSERVGSFGFASRNAFTTNAAAAAAAGRVHVDVSAVPNGGPRRASASAGGATRGERDPLRVLESLSWASRTDPFVDGTSVLSVTFGFHLPSA